MASEKAAAVTEITPVLVSTVPSVGVMSDEQFALFIKAQVLSNIVGGYLAGGKQPTPNKANLETLRAYADAVVEMVNEDAQ